MASTETKISKQGAAATIWDIKLTIPVTLEIIRKPEVLKATVSSWQHTTLDS